MKPTTPPTLAQLLQEQMDVLRLSLRPSTVRGYQNTVRHFLTYLHTVFPHIHRPRQLRRDPHLIGWFAHLCQQQPPLCNATREKRLFCLRRLFEELSANGHRIAPDLIRRSDFPPPRQYLPRPLSLGDDQLLLQELRRCGDLYCLALLLIRSTGMRIGECLDLALDCLHQISEDQWALHVPLGKLHSERLVPADAELRQCIARILELRAAAPAKEVANSVGLLLPRPAMRSALAYQLRRALAAAAVRAGCAGHVTPHRLRHSFASEMVRLSVSLPALMQMMGHTDIRMSLWYVQVTQQDVQREYYQAREKAAASLPLPVPMVGVVPPVSGIAGIQQAISATRHLIEMYRRQQTKQVSGRLHRLDQRLSAVATQLERITTDKK